MRGDSFSVDIGNLNEIARRLGPEAVRVVGTELGNGVDASVKVAAEAANALIDSRSGELVRNVEFDTRAGRQEIAGVATWTRPYARFVNFGRGWVYPKTARVLRFVTRDGEIVFARAARPAPPQNFTVRGAVAAGPKINAIMTARMAAVVRYLEGGGR